MSSQQPINPNLNSIYLVDDNEPQHPDIAPDHTVSLRNFHDVCQGDPKTAETMVPGITSKQGVHRLKRDQKTGEMRVHLPTPQARTQYAQNHAVRQVQKSQEQVPEYISVEDLKAYYSKQPQGQFNKDFPTATSPNGAANLMRTNILGQTMFVNPRHPKIQKLIQDQQGTVEKLNKYSPEAQKMLQDAAKKNAETP